MGHQQVVSKKPRSSRTIFMNCPLLRLFRIFHRVTYLVPYQKLNVVKGWPTSCSTMLLKTPGSYRIKLPHKQLINLNIYTISMGVGFGPRFGGRFRTTLTFFTKWVIVTAANGGDLISIVFFEAKAISNQNNLRLDFSA